MESRSVRWTPEELLEQFDEHLRRGRGLCTGTRRQYERYVAEFLQSVSVRDVVDPAGIGCAEVIDYIAAVAHRYRGSTSVELAATSLRSFFRFLRAVGLRADRLEDVVPAVPSRRLDLPRHLGSAQLDRLVRSLDSSTAGGLRDRAIVLCIARLGLRAGEVCQLELGDIDWRVATVGVRRRKSGHGAVLPLLAEVGQAIADYLQHGRPSTASQRLFVSHAAHGRGTAIGDSVVGQAVDQALRRAGIDTPWSGANLLRHSLATDLLAGGATLGEIAAVMGHRSLATTGIYARVDVAALAEVGLPWPQAVTS